MKESSQGESSGSESFELPGDSMPPTKIYRWQQTFDIKARALISYQYWCTSLNTCADFRLIWSSRKWQIRLEISKKVGSSRLFVPIVTEESRKSEVLSRKNHFYGLFSIFAVFFQILQYSNADYTYPFPNLVFKNKEGSGDTYSVCLSGLLAGWLAFRTHFVWLIHFL